MDLTACPTCTAPASISERHPLPSTDGPIEHARITCTAGHWFVMPVSLLAGAS